MRPSTQSFVLLAGMAGVLLAGQPAAAERPVAARAAVCVSPAAAVPEVYWFYHALASHPGLYEPRTRSIPCPARKAIRT